MNSKDLTVTAPSSGTTNSATERYTIMRGSTLDHFEGRTWAGWHHHTTLVSAAHLFATTLRLEDDPKAPTAA